MRITRSIMVRDFITRSELQMERMNQLNMQMASGERVLKASDDPSGLARIFRYETSIKRIDGYLTNASIACAWSETTQQGISEGTSLVQKALEQAMLAASDTNSKEANLGISQSVKGYLEELLSIANRSQNGRNLFSGTMTSTDPFVRLERGIELVGSLPSGIDAVTTGSPFPDLPELERGVYTIEVTSDGVNATVALKQANGAGVMIDDNNQDDTTYYSSYNHMANTVTVTLGETADTGRGFRIETSASMASGTQSFRVMYTPDGSYEYVGNAGMVKSKIGEDMIVDTNVCGHTFLQADTVIGSKAIDPVNGTLIPVGGGDLSFTISDGTTTRTVTFAEGVTYTQSDVLNLLDQAGLFVGTSDSYDDEVFIQASFDDQGHLRLRTMSEGIPSKIVLNDVGTGTNNMQNCLGLTPGQTDGISILDQLNALARNISADVASSRIFAPSDWAGASSVDVSRDGVFTGATDATWVFTVGTTGGLVGETEGVTITVTDAANGSVIKTIDVGEAYTSGESIYIADGVSVSLSGRPGELEAGDSFTLDLRCDRSGAQELSDAITHLIKREAFAGTTLQYMEMVTEKLTDYQVVLKQQLEEQSGISITETMAKLEQEELAYQASLSIGARILNQPTLLNYL